VAGATSCGKALVLRALEAVRRPVDGLAGRLGDLSRVINFTRGRLEFSIRPDDVFIVTYPRSGTTLMQLLVHLLVRSGDPAHGHDLDLDLDFDFEHISQVAPWFERSLAVGSLEVSDLAALPSPRVFKSHLAQQWVPRGARTIHVTRDGRDVAVSYYHFYRSHLRYTGSFDRFFERFLRGDVQYRSWFKHTAGWQARRGDPELLFLRFEDLVHALPACVAAVARFLGVAASFERIAQIAERCSFERMKRHEQKFDFATELLLERRLRGGDFLRSGRTGAGSALRPEQERAFARRAGRRPRLARVELDLPAFLH